MTPDMHAETHAFLERWFAHCPPKHFVEVRPRKCEAATQRGERPLSQRWYSSLAEAERFCLEAHAHNDHVYIGAIPRTRKGGGSNKDAGPRLWLWADIDFGTVGHKTPAHHPTRESALDALNKLPAPSILVDTGGGLHAWWAIRSHDRTDTEWEQTIIRIAYAIGGDMNVKDAARILRVPGTLNLKVEDEPRMVRLLHCSSDLFQISDFDDLEAPPAEKPIPFRPRPTSSVTGDRPFDRANDVPIVNVLSWLGVKMHREGHRVYCACPVHGGHNESQMVVGGEDYNTARCYGDCDRSWTNVDIVSAAHSIEPRAAVNELAAAFGFDGFPPERPAPVTQGPANDPSDWRQALARDAKDRLLRVPSNVTAILLHDERWAGVLGYNEMTKRPVLLQPAPWTEDCRRAPETGPLEGADVTRMRAWLQRHYNLDATKECTIDGIDIASRASSYHPVRQYLSGLRWDGVCRIDMLAADALGNTGELEAIMVRKFMISCVARAFVPGDKVDTSLVLMGPQGWRKSSFFAALGGEWFADTAIMLGNKDAYMQIHSAWIYEFAEIDSLMSNRSASDVKAFASSASDTFRAPYAPDIQTHKRSTVIVGTTNQEHFLTDDTGARRWWCVEVMKHIDTPPIRVMRDQLWAEAVSVYQAETSLGRTHVDQACPWWLTDDEASRHVELTKEMSTTLEDQWYDRIAQYTTGRSEVYARDIMDVVLSIPVERQNAAVGKRVASILRHLGWVSGKRIGDRRVWRRKNPVQNH